LHTTNDVDETGWHPRSVEGSTEKSAAKKQFGDRYLGIVAQTKKTARTLSYPCREASDANYFRLGVALHNRNKYTIA
jgi:hypothetical protein